jgi:inner membrane protein
MVAFYLVVMIGSAVGGRALVHRALIAQNLAGNPSIMAGPVPINPFQREVVVSDGQIYRFGTITWRPMPDLRMEAHTLARNDDHPLAKAAAQTPEARDFLVWSRFPFFIVEEDQGGTRVILDDARYSTGRGRSFAAVVVEM